MEDTSILIKRRDGGYIIETNYPFRTKVFVRSTANGMMDVVAEYFAEPFSADSSEAASAVEESLLNNSDDV